MNSIIESQPNEKRVGLWFANSLSIVFFLVLCAIRTETYLLAATNEITYFPTNFDGQWYVQHLTAMKEPSLFESRNDPDYQAYRFLWLRTFHNPIAVRAEKSKSGATLQIVRLTGKGGYEPGEIAEKKTKSLSDAEWTHFLELLEKSTFWQLDPKDDVKIKFDGAHWIMEGVVSGRYHVADRWCPDEDTAKRGLAGYRSACLFLLKSASMDLPRKEVY